MLIDTAALISDRVILVNPTVANLKFWEYPLKRFNALAKENLLIGIYLSEKPKHYEISGVHYARKDLIEDKLFFPDYDLAIELDSKDENLIELIQKTYSEKTSIEIEDYIYCLNWDLILAQVLNCPIISTTQQQSLWEYKVKQIFKEVSATQESLRVKDDVNLAMKIILDTTKQLPSDLTEEQILTFRRNSASKNFREWFGTELSKALVAESITGISHEEQIHQRFDELVSSHKDSLMLRTIVSSIGVAVINLLGFSPLTPVVPIAVNYGLPKLLRSIWKKYSKNNWVFFLLDMKKK